MRLIIIIFLVNFCKGDVHKGGILYPRNTETREVVSLDGIWAFVVGNTSYPFQGHIEKWYQKGLESLKSDYDVQRMPVPSSYNDITTDPKIRDHVGVVWYETKFFVPSTWQNNGRVWLRFGSISYAGEVWINGELTMLHGIGHLPFAGEITDYIKFGVENILTVACDNTLLADTVPQGTVSQLPSGRIKENYSFDFFNYAGIDRPVFLYRTPSSYIDDITLETNLENDTAILHYNITTIGEGIVGYSIGLFDGNLQVNENILENSTGHIRVSNPKLWWPYLMDPNPGFLYTFRVEISDADGNVLDIYRMKVGLRTISWTDTQLLINNKPVYLHGFGRHEDSDIRGKGFDYALSIRDHNLIRWIGANVYRTSHYPYAEEILDMAEEFGIMIIDECPSVNTEFFSDSLKTTHKKSLTELIKRDKNRAAVIMWSAANEPRTQYPEAGDYFKDIIDHIKSLDKSRPTTIVEAFGPVVNSSLYVDIINFNKYSGWYSEVGDLDLITDTIISYATEWHNKYKKPVILQEYGADTLEGLHFLPDFIWSEEYQVELMSKYFEAFDKLRKQNFFIGEFIWNFADFKTAQSITRVGGNKKGIFTRNRQPKRSAFHLRQRYWMLAHEYHNVTLPDDLTNYVISPSSTVKLHDEF